MPVVVDVEDLKSQLDIKTDSDLVELIDRLEEAEAEYAEHVRPLPGTYTEPMALPAHLPAGTTTASAALNGSALDVTFTARTGLLWSRTHTYGTDVDVTYTVGPVPLNHAGAIAADVAEYWERTQQSPGGRPGFEDPYGAPGGRAPRPVTMWPRIRALAPGSFA